MQLTLTNDSPYEQWLAQSQEIGNPHESDDFWLTNGEILEKYQVGPYPQDFIHAYKLDEEMKKRIAEKRKLAANPQEWMDYVEYHIPTLDPLEEKHTKWQEGKEDRRQKSIDECGQMHFFWKINGWKLKSYPWFCNRYNDCKHCRKRLVGEREKMLLELIGHRLLVVPKENAKDIKNEYHLYLRIPLDDGRVAFIVDDSEDVGYDLDHRCVKWLAEESISTGKDKGRMSGKLGKETTKMIKGEKSSLDDIPDVQLDNPMDEKYDYLDNVSFDDLFDRFKRHLKEEQGGIEVEDNSGNKQEVFLGNWEDLEDPIGTITTREFTISPEAITMSQLEKMVLQELELDVNMPRTIDTLQYIVYQVEEKTKEIALRHCEKFHFIRKKQKTIRESNIDWSIFEKIPK